MPKADTIKYDYIGGKIELRKAGQGSFISERTGLPETVEWKDAVFIVEDTRKSSLSKNAILKLAELVESEGDFCMFLNKL